ncbi:MAG: hydratase [Deltaproteobacteria bacterium]|jgi:aconitate hydratase|nr:hydratase [Deltaproteobacteria bacterium]
MPTPITSTFSAENPGVYLKNGQWLSAAQGAAPPDEARSGSMAYSILEAHNTNPGGDPLRLVFDALVSHDITYVSIIQTARAGGLTSFPLPYILTNCHNSLCAVGGTINEDDHLFGLSAARKYGGDFVPAHLAVIHQYAREALAGGGRMILGSDSHTRYGPLGTMGFGEGGPELVKQLLRRTYDLPRPEVVAVCLEGAPRPGVGPQDVALALIAAVFRDGLVRNKILEFLGPGLSALSVDFRLGIDVMTTETACLSSIWQTDEAVRDWLAVHGRSADFKALAPAEGTWYDGLIRVDLSAVEPMIALPFHPSNAWSIREFLDNAQDLLAGVEAEAKDLAPTGLRPKLGDKLRGKDFFADQGIVAGCSGGTFENIARMAEILDGRSTGQGAFSLSLYPASQPQYLEMVRSGLAARLMQAGVVCKTAFCGPCFGAGDIPGNNAFSIRHTTRNFPNREGSKPPDGQMAYVALMDARSIAATALNNGKLTPATDLEGLGDSAIPPYSFSAQVYKNRVYRGFAQPRPAEELILGPNITDWPPLPPLPENLILRLASAIHDPVTTTDELMPSGETSSYRSNPQRLAQFALSRKDPDYVSRARDIQRLEQLRQASLSADPAPARTTISELFASVGLAGREADSGIGSAVFAMKPGDGSAREQAASSQRILGGWANIAGQYATKRYRGNLINWGLLPFILDEPAAYGLKPGDTICLPGIRSAIAANAGHFSAALLQDGKSRAITLRLPDFSAQERAVALAGSLINFYRQEAGQGFALSGA